MTKDIYSYFWYHVENNNWDDYDPETSSFYFLVTKEDIKSLPDYNLIENKDVVKITESGIIDVLSTLEYHQEVFVK